MRNHNLRQSLWPAAFQVHWKDILEQMVHLSAARPKLSGSESAKQRIQAEPFTTHLWWSSLIDLWILPNLEELQTIHCIQCVEPGCETSHQTLRKLQQLGLPPLKFPVTERRTWWEIKLSSTHLSSTVELQLLFRWLVCQDLNLGLRRDHPAFRPLPQSPLEESWTST